MTIRARSAQAAFRASMPVFFGYLAIGSAFGLMISSIGYNAFVAFVMSVFIYAGAGQYLAVQMFAQNKSLLDMAILTFLVNARHMVYGLSLFDRFKETGRKKPYMIFSLTDETYALLTSTVPPPDVERGWYFFFIALYDQFYWVLGGVLGAAVGSIVKLDPQGLDFALTAMFVVLLIDALRDRSSRLPVVIGAGVGLGVLLVLGPDNMLILSVAALLLVLLIARRWLEPLLRVSEAGSAPVQAAGEAPQAQCDAAPHAKGSGDALRGVAGRMEREAVAARRSAVGTDADAEWEAIE